MGTDTAIVGNIKVLALWEGESGEGKGFDLIGGLVMAEQHEGEQKEDRARLAWWAILDELDRYRAIMSAGLGQTESTDDERKRDLRPRKHRRAS